MLPLRHTFTNQVHNHFILPVGISTLLKGRVYSNVQPPAKKEVSPTFKNVVNIIMGLVIK